MKEVTIEAVEGDNCEDCIAFGIDIACHKAYESFIFCGLPDCADGYTYKIKEK